VTTKQRRGSPDGLGFDYYWCVPPISLLAPSCPVLSPTGVSSSALLLLLAPHRMRILLCPNQSYCAKILLADT
jgi:hypothetical protein